MFSLFGKKDKAQPKPQGGVSPTVLTMREKLYTTASLEPLVSRLQDNSKSMFPWSNFAEADQALKQNDNAKAINLLKQVTGTEGLETRIYLQAWHSLRSLGEMPPASIGNQVQGFIMENYWEKEGLDVLAVFSDHSARYWDHSGAGVVWDARDPEIDQLIDKLLGVGQEIINWIGIKERANPPVPQRGSVRFFITAYGGSCMGGGGLDELARAKDVASAKSITAGYDLIKALLKKTEKTRK